MDALPDGTLPAVFALLDDAQAAGLARSRLYTGFVETLSCTDPAALDDFWAQVDARLAEGLFAVLLGDYEWGVALQRLPDPRTWQRASARGRARTETLARQGAAALSDAERFSDASASRSTDGRHAPALRVLWFRERRFLTPADVDAWLSGMEDERQRTTASPPLPAGIADLRQSVDASAFSDALDRIHTALEAGDCYQINYTFRLAFNVFGSPLSLYRHLRARQPAAYGALIRTDRGWTLSSSPELFLQHRAGRLVAKPMKGTAARDSDPDRDAQRGVALAADPKNRAENVMIVDLLRNDLGRIAPPGAVSVSSLFAVEAWPTVWQMTSTVEAVLPPATGFPDVLRALFPCGSITGAPKRAAIDLIESLESTPRGLYSGAIGWIDAPALPATASGRASHVTAPETSTTGIVVADETGETVSALSDPAADAVRTCGDFCLSVAIRTINVAPHAIDGVRPATAGIGAGIVLESQPVDEYEECLLKARFLTGADPGFALFETMAANRDGVPLRERHLARLRASASQLGFRYDAAEVNAVLDRTIAQLAAGTDTGPAQVAKPATTLAGDAYRVKLSLSKDGAVVCTSAPLRALAAGPVDVMLGREHGFPDRAADDFLLRFKTTYREVYDRAWQQAEQAGAFDMIFANHAGRLTEGGRSNLFVKLDGCWYTPPVSDGLLPGVMRAVVLEDPNWNVIERSLSVDALFEAEALALSNGLRGIVPARLARSAKRA